MVSFCGGWRSGVNLCVWRDGLIWEHGKDRETCGIQFCDGGPQHVFSETDMSKMGGGDEHGLSGLHARWKSQDADGGDEIGSASECGSAITLSGTPPPPPTSWKLWMKLQYEPGTGNLHVTVFRAKASAAGRMPEGYQTTVYVAAMLLPEQDIRQTAAYPNTGSPSFDETLSFQMNADQVDKGQIRLSLYELNQERTRICLGHAVVRLEGLGLGSGAVHYADAVLEPLVSAMDSPAPQIHVSLSYNTLKEKLKIQVFAARNLPPPDTRGEYKYYLRTQVILGSRSVKVKRTQPAHSLDGVFGANYAFQVPAKHMDQCGIQLSVIRVLVDDEGRRLGEEIWGEAAMGPCIYAHGTGLHHWKTMLGNTRKSIDMWHKLVPPDRSAPP